MRRKIIYYAFAAFCLSSCGNDDTNSGSGSALKPLSIASVSLSGSQTKSTTPAIGTAVGVFRLTGTGDYTTSQDNLSYTLGAGSLWAPTLTTSKILLGPKSATLCAYLPYSASATLTALPLVSQIDGTANDVCYKTSIAASAVSPAITFDMQHALSKITFTISPDASYTGACTINNITVANAGILKNSSLNLKTSVYTNESTPTGSVSFNPGIAGITSGNTATASVLMVPVTTTLTGTITLTINVDGANKTASFAASLLPLLAAGSNYNIPVTISGISIIVGSVSTVDWSSVAMHGIDYLQETSNCYIVAPNSTVSIPVIRAYAANAANFSSSTMPWTTGLLWTDVANPLTSSGTIASITGISTSSIDGAITVTTGSATGNAVVYVMNSSSQICWSWHIWVTSYDPSAINISYNSITWMDRNLGATNNTPNDVGNMGLYYQWGRKDPFSGPTKVNGILEKTLYGTVSSVTLTPVATSPNLATAIQNPATFYYGTSANSCDWYALAANTHNDALWGSTKTIYDPCPIGWEVPTNGSWASGLSGTWSSNGYSFTNAGWYQASGYRDNNTGAFSNVGSAGYYWSSPVCNVYAYNLGFYNGYVGSALSGYSSRASGYSVRCIKE